MVSPVRHFEGRCGGAPKGAFYCLGMWGESVGGLHGPLELLGSETGIEVKVPEIRRVMRDLLGMRYTKMINSAP